MKRKLHEIEYNCAQQILKYILFSTPFPTKDVYIRPMFCHATTDDVYIRPQIKSNTESSVVCDALNKISPVVEKVWHYFIKTADQSKLLIAFLYAVLKIIKWRLDHANEE